jgi:hypothetical protein
LYSTVCDFAVCAFVAVARLCAFSKIFFLSIYANVFSLKGNIENVGDDDIIPYYTELAEMAKLKGTRWLVLFLSLYTWSRFYLLTRNFSLSLSLVSVSVSLFLCLSEEVQRNS